MKILLKMKKSLKYVDGTWPEPIHAPTNFEWKKHDRTTYNFIHMNVEDDQVGHIISTTTVVDQSMRSSQEHSCLKMLRG